MRQTEMSRFVDGCVQETRILFARINAARDAAPVDMFGLLADLGIEVVAAPLGKDNAGWMHNDRKSGLWTMCHSSTQRLCRIRWTLAHLLGHYVYHRDLMLGAGVNETTTSCDQTDALPFRNDRITPAYETQANAFAAGLLFTEKAVRELHAAGLNVFQIADRLENSVQATGIRLRQLGLAH